MKKSYGELYSEDAFEGISVPFELKSVIEHIINNEEDLIIEVFDNYEEYKDEEVEMSHYAKDGSDGTFDINTVDEFKKWFYNKFKSRIKAGRISQTTIDLINGLQEIIISDVLSDDEARILLDKVIKDLEEININSSFSKTPDYLINLIKFRDKWLDQVI